MQLGQGLGRYACCRFDLWLVDTMAPNTVPVVRPSALQELSADLRIP